MKRTPFCKECKYYLCNGICNHPKFGGEYSHVNKDFWCCYGEKKEKTNNPPDLCKGQTGKKNPRTTTNQGRPYCITAARMNAIGGKHNGENE